MTNPSAHILVVDDDADVLTAARLALTPIFRRVETARTAVGLTDAITVSSPDVLLLDMNFSPGTHSGDEGLTWLDRVRATDSTLSVVLMTAFGGVTLAVEALKRGAVDFVLKPWQNEKLIATISAAVALTRARRETADLKVRNTILAIESGTKSGEIIGSAPALARVLDIAGRAARSDANILILGESGTGKELMAREIHRQSARASQPFVSVDLGAISENLFESELFGHRRGAFTGADHDRGGRIQASNGGTLFLDEIGNLPLHLQRKLLTVLERREVTPVGANCPVSIDIRLVTATNRSAAELTREEIFRQDLLFRIKTVELIMPPLRERREDIPVLLEHYLAFYARKANAPRRRLSPETLARLESYDWPGNIRELRHAVERATILAGGERLELEDFPFLTTERHSASAETLDLDGIERQAIQKALLLHQGNISHASAALGLTRPALYRRMAKHGL
jgi:DNA-binding NtrC family response regulator